MNYFGEMDTSQNGIESPDPSTEMLTAIRQPRWFYPSYLSNDLSTVNLTRAEKDEVLTCAFEYARSVIPYTHRSNQTRYLAFMRTIIIGTVAEFRGDLVDVTAGNHILGYDLNNVLDDLFGATRLR
jgi:hypothetical protein